MATTRKARTKSARKSGPAERTSEIGAEPKADAVVETTAVVKPRARTSYRIVLREGASYSDDDVSIVAGRPFVTTDPRLYERFRFNGRFSADVVVKGAKA